ncbi:MAG: hypothetical protein KC421_22970 [Anaerolineales bacterium]|nr:hypothetical protein [Anaerolineales bacterium]
MHVQVEIELDVPPTTVHHEFMQRSANSLTNDKNSVHITTPKDREMMIMAEFTMQKARQGDVVDKIGKTFHFIKNYQDITIWFPKKASHRPIAAKSYTPKQGQYLAFIYYYTKLNGRSPAERDIQNYFKTTPPTVHRMILELEKRGLITRVPNQPRSIKLLLSRAEIPDLN